ncbi:MAG: glycosyltransferase family 2 protein [Flavobacteriales bacterium]|nr:glycosyltransferase family 2 protein [Flavobacteriales bacterium]MCX7649571.1 glycosyltransferase family 2 protein [Flavobacteriales bacterium]MDW8431678.1 glycosyltransferase family 2 protein [Flavobacteriales bacterium]
MTPPDLSLVIPLLNERESLPELTEWIHRVCTEAGLSYELLFVDDGSQDGSWDTILEMNQRFPTVRGIRFRRNYGKSAALNVGFQEVRGRVVITMDADLQDSPDEIPALFRMITEEKYDLVSGWKKKRYDPLSKTLPTKLFNAVTRWVSGIPLHDFNCGLKAYDACVVKSIEVFGEMHRYIPILAKQAGFKRIGEKVVTHRARKYGHSKFGLNRFMNGLLDLFTIVFLTRFGKKPMHFFGPWGLLLFLAGFAIAAYLAVAKVVFEQYRMTERPIFYLGLLCMVVGSQLFLAGFLGELVLRNSAERNTYLIREKLA